jgi:hypothetical protein
VPRFALSQAFAIFVIVHPTATNCTSWMFGLSRRHT